MSTYTARIHQYTDSVTGHVNIEILENNISKGFYGTTVSAIDIKNGISGGVYKETLSSVDRIKSHPHSHTSVDIDISTNQYELLTDFVYSKVHQTNLGYGTYNLNCGNCVTFIGETLQIIGLGRYNLSNYLLQGPSITKAYAEVEAFLCGNEYNDMIDIMSTYNILDYKVSAPIADFLVNEFGMQRDFYLYEFSYMQLLEEYLGKGSESDYAEELTLDYEDFGSPIVLDLNSDGIDTINLKDSTAFFDIDNDGVQERTGWLNPDDGFLFLDKNINGIVDNQSELFGGKRGEGFEKLSSFDSNKDRVIDSEDDACEEIQVWVDNNSDGLSTVDEIFSLVDQNIESIDLNFIYVGEYNNYNLVGEQSTAIINNKDSIVQDIYFRYEDDNISLTDLFEDENQIFIDSEKPDNPFIDKPENIEFYSNNINDIDIISLLQGSGNAAPEII